MTIDVETYQATRRWMLLALGVIMTAYGAITAKPELLTAGGALLGLDPMLRAGDRKTASKPADGNDS